MELKMNYQYTYFIHPFLIKENKYQKYLLKMLKEKNCKLKVFEKAKDLKLYQYFLPKAREFLFSSFSFNESKIKKLEKLSVENKAVELAKYQCNIFEYTLEKNVQGKVDEQKGIFFTIPKIEVICFKTGICFVAIKTHIEDEMNFSNVLNFNYKFRDINQDGKLNAYDNIRLQSNNFSSTETLNEFIKRITSSNLIESKELDIAKNDDNAKRWIKFVESKNNEFINDNNCEFERLNINSERFLTYSYVCIDQEHWNASNDFDKIKHNFLKYSMILPADSNISIVGNKVQELPRWKYATIGTNRAGVFLFCSSTDMNNYTVLPEEFEEEYLYTYIFSLYKNIKLKKILTGFSNSKNIKKTQKEFVNFTNKLWDIEITEDETGLMFVDKIDTALDLRYLYQNVKNKYDIMYKELNTDKSCSFNVAAIVFAVVVTIINFVSFIMLR